MRYDQETVSVGDRVKLALCDGYMTVTDVDSDGISVIDHFGTPYNGVPFGDIESLKLPSE